MFCIFLRTLPNLLLLYSVGFERGNLRVCTFKLRFSILLYMPQAVNWFCYSTVISKRGNSCLIYFKHSSAAFMFYLQMLQVQFPCGCWEEEVTGHFYCLLCLEVSPLTLLIAF